MSKKWSAILFIIFNIGIGMPGLFLFVSALYLKKWLLFLFVYVLLWFFGNFFIVKRTDTAAKLVYFLFAAVIVIASAFIFSKPLFGFR